MPSLYAPMGGVNTKQKSVWGLISGVNTKMKNGWGLLSGVNTKIFNSEPEWKTSTIASLPNPEAVGLSSSYNWDKYHQAVYYNGKVYHFVTAYKTGGNTNQYLYALIYDIASNSYSYKQIFYAAAGSRYDGRVIGCCCHLSGNYIYILSLIHI
mgnify:FL=1